MFSSALSVGTRLNDWKTKPSFSRRSFVSWRSESWCRSTPPTMMRPDVNVSRPARQCINVDLPEPDGPMIAVQRPAGIATSTPSSARTAVSPDPYTFTACSARTAVGANDSEARAAKARDACCIGCSVFGIRGSAAGFGETALLRRW